MAATSLSEGAVQFGAGEKGDDINTNVFNVRSLQVVLEWQPSGVPWLPGLRHLDKSWERVSQSSSCSELELFCTM